MSEIKNHGLDIHKTLAGVSPEQYVFGSNQIAGVELQPDGQWTDYLPTKEMQRQNAFESSACTCFGSLNALETLQNRLYGEKRNYSERYLGVLAENTPTGNDPHKVAETMRKKGAIPDRELPFSTEIDTWDEYYSPNPMTRKYLNMGESWLEEYLFGHEWVYTGGSVSQKQKLMMSALRFSPLCVSVVAWRKGDDGLYYKNSNDVDGHWVMLYGYVENDHWLVFDHYDDIYKKLRWNYDFGVCKRYHIEKRTTPLHGNWLDDLIHRLWVAFKDVVGLS